MKLILVFFGLLSYSVFGQTSIQILYKSESILNHDEIDKLFPNDVDTRNQIISEASKQRAYSLNVKNNFSVFMENSKLYNQLQDNSTKIDFGNENARFFKDLKNKISFEEKILNKTYLVKDSLPKLKWKIINEKKKWGELELKKATLFDHKDSIEIIAWYAPKISISDGPEVFYGLPGLIIELQINYLQKTNPDIVKTYFYRVLKIEFESIEDIVLPKKLKIISKEEFQKLEEKFNQKTIDMLSGGVEKD
jgi:GLPGLI family protein